MTPKNREELIEHILKWAEGHKVAPDAIVTDTQLVEMFIGAIEAAGIDLVPRELTDEMKRAAWAEQRDIEDSTTPFDFRGADVTRWTWKAMLSASPFRPA